MMSLPDPNRAPRAPKRFLPYRPFILDPTLPLEIVSVAVDGQDETDAVVEPARCRIRPHLIGDWDSASVEIRIADLREEIAIQSGLESSAEAVDVFGRLSCRETRLRRPVRLSAEGDHLVGMLGLERRDVRDKVELQVMAVRATRPTTPIQDVGHHRGSLLALSPIWVIEERDLAMPSGGAFDVAYVDFAAPAPSGPYRGEDAEELKQVPDALVHVVFRPEGPLVVMNEHHPDLRAVLFSKGTRGWRARLRDLLSTRIAATVWRSVLIEAWQQLRPAEGFPDPDDRTWADLGDEHWTTRALQRAATLRTKKADEPICALLDLIEDESTRAGVLTGLTERLATETGNALPRLVGELDGK